MSLDQDLQICAGHTLYYRKSNQDALTLKSFSQSFNPTDSVCFVTESILLNPIFVLQEISNSLKKKKGHTFEDIPNLVRLMYGQLRALKTLSDTDKLITTPSTMVKFENSLDILESTSDSVLELYKKCPFHNSNCESFVNTLLDESFKLSRGLWGHEYRGNLSIVEDLILEYKATSFYQKKVRLSNKIQTLSKEDLLLFAIASYESTRNYSGEKTYLLSNNSPLLALGPIFVGHQNTLRAPQVLCSELGSGSGKIFQHHFELYQQPHLANTLSKFSK